ncbi:GNAT family N-acetyltransferase [Paramicrobacterium fandaimingii]|uniref:GNAT family N-acetyltransferase n=1 Tax=Paramicrobacterium fandaimingii TaxID=2708079 RepID=UPI001420A828|nr:GNAT family N-acetyltransferase [Microbacterium fandaimingii]
MSARSSRRTSRTKKRTQETEIRYAKSSYLSEKRAISRTRYWHGGKTGLKVGTVLVSRAEAERSGADMTQYDLQNGYDANVTDPERVYFSSKREFARGYAGLIQTRDLDTGAVFRQGALYEVEPMGRIANDPDFDKGVSWCASRARIIAVEETNVNLDAYEISERLGPYMSWTDGSPIYKSGGRYLPSPEQIAFLGDVRAQALAMSFFPWTPVEFINAAAVGEPSGDRPNPRHFPDVAVGAVEAIQVMKEHRKRALALTRLGVTFSHDPRPHLVEINALLPLAGRTVLKDDDERGTIIAIHPRDGLIGTMVLTGVEVGGKCVMFIDAIAVTPEWRNRGIGSVMLLLAQQILPARVSFAAGHCEPKLAGFFSQAGYTVLRAGVKMILPFGDGPEIIDVGTEHSWFYRQGPV